MLGGGREGQRCMARVFMRVAIIAAGARALARAPNSAHNLVLCSSRETLGVNVGAFSKDILISLK